MSQMTMTKMAMEMVPTMAPVDGEVPTTSAAKPAGQDRAVLLLLRAL